MACFTSQGYAGHACSSPSGPEPDRVGGHEWRSAESNFSGLRCCVGHIGGAAVRTPIKAGHTSAAAQKTRLLHYLAGTRNSRRSNPPAPNSPALCRCGQLLVQSSAGRIQLRLKASMWFLGGVAEARGCVDRQWLPGVGSAACRTSSRVKRPYAR